MSEFLVGFGFDLSDIKIFFDLNTVGICFKLQGSVVSG